MSEEAFHMLEKQRRLSISTTVSLEKLARYCEAQHCGFAEGGIKVASVVSQPCETQNCWFAQVASR